MINDTNRIILLNLKELFGMKYTFSVTDLNVG